jgi:NAD(P)-dependent dehydrogenase (short-subunit alcohol dehydrogenase family)
MNVDLRGATALVTGGSRGIGAAIVRCLHGAGANVYFTYISAAGAAETLCAELGSERVACERCDNADSVALERLVAHALARFGRIDTLVNNAAVYAENAFEGDDFAGWRAGWARTFAINVFGAADLTYLVMRAMRASKPNAAGVRGRIVNVTSRAAHRGELTFPDYGASKAALGNLTRSIARACARDGIVAFAVAPGFILTEMAAAAIAQDGDAIRAEIPGGRVGTPEEVAQIVAFCASGGADYATGTTIDVNGASYVR